MELKLFIFICLTVFSSGELVENVEMNKNINSGDDVVVVLWFFFCFFFFQSLTFYIHAKKKNKKQKPHTVKHINFPERPQV